MSQAVSDAGPLIHLAQIKKLQLLKRIFKRISVTPRVKWEVVDEGIKLGRDDALAVRKAMEEGWIVIEDTPKAMTSAAKRLAEGENISRLDAETILLAEEKGAKMTLVDEKVLSDLAKMYGLEVWSTWTILLEAFSRGFIEIHDIESAINELGERRHKLKANQAAEILEAAKLVASRGRERE